MKKNVVIIIQARSDSKRLPQKMLSPINNLPLIDYIVLRCKESKIADSVVVATTSSQSDDDFADLLKSKNYNYFRGNEKNVLNRYYECASFFSADVIVRVTGDNPFIDYYLIDNLLKLLLNNQNIDYASAKKYPIGLASEVFTFNALEKCYKNAVNTYELEHVTPYFYENPNLFNIEYIVNHYKFDKNIRLTLDTYEDLSFIKKVYQNFNYFTLIESKKVVDFLNNNPELLNINKNIKQKSYKEVEK